MRIGGRGMRSIASTPRDRDEYGTQLSDELRESLRRPAYVFTVSCSLANTVKKDVGLSNDKRFRIVVSVQRGVPFRGKHFADVVTDSASCRRSP